MDKQTGPERIHVERLSSIQQLDDVVDPNSNFDSPSHHEKRKDSKWKINDEFSWISSSHGGSINGVFPV